MRTKLTAIVAAGLLAVFLGSSIAEARVGSTVERRQRPGKGWHHYYGHTASKNYSRPAQSWSPQRQGVFSQPIIARQPVAPRTPTMIAGGRVISERVISVEPAATQPPNPQMGQSQSPDLR
jgi:hypothetical protein